MGIKKIKQKKIKGKPKKRSSPKKRANVVASAPTRDVIININTTRPRARREPSQRVVPKRNEDLSARIIESELFQSNFRATQLIKEQAEKIKLFDRRLSVLTDVIDNERNRPLITEPAPTDQPPLVAEAVREPQEIQVAEAVRATPQDIQVAEAVREPAKPERPRQSVFLQQLLSERESQERLKQEAQRQEESERASLKARQLGEEQEEQPLERKKKGRPALTPEQKEENKRIREQEAKKLVQQQKPPDTQPRKLTVLELMKLNQGEQQGELFFKSFGGRKV